MDIAQQTRALNALAREHGHPGDVFFTPDWSTPGAFKQAHRATHGYTYHSAWNTFASTVAWIKRNSQA